MFEPNLVSQLNAKLGTSSSVLILLPSNPDIDSLSAALGLYLTLKNNNKKVTIGCSSTVKVSQSHLFGINKIKKNIGSKTLVISFEYQEESAEHVSYDIDEANNQFHLRIRPKKGAQPLDTKNINYSYTGAEADLVITLGINSLEELGKTYATEKKFLDEAHTANFTLGHKPSTFATLNLNAPQSSSLSEAISLLLKKSGLNLTADAATNFYQQITTSTQNFTSPKTTANTFEAAAFLLRSGASRQPVAPASQPTTQPKAPLTPQFLTPPPTFPASPQQPPHPAKESSTSKILTSPPTQPQKQGVPPDWQGPKIYRGGSNFK